MNKQLLTIGGTLIFLFGIFGYIFPDWRSTVFSNNENLFHVLTGLLALMAAQFPPSRQNLSLMLFMVLYLALGIYGFSFKQPAAAHIGPVFLQLDAFDNYLHIFIGFIFGWFWLSSRKS